MRRGKITFPNGPLMSSRIRAHLRNNLVGYIALFCFALGGTAYATHPGGEKTISSIDIIDDEVFSDDVANDTLAGGGLAAADLRPNSVGTSEVGLESLTISDLGIDSVGVTEIRPGAVGSNEVAADALTGSDIATDSLSSSDVGANAVGTSELAQVPGARAFATAAQSIADGGVATLNLEAENFDTGGLYTAPSDHITISVPGTYMLAGDVGYDPDPHGARWARIQVDGSTVAVNQTVGTSPAVTRVPVSTIARLSAGDAVTLQIGHRAGNSLATSVYGGSGLGRGYLAVQWLSD